MTLGTGVGRKRRDILRSIFLLRHFSCRCIQRNSPQARYARGAVGILEIDVVRLKAYVHHSADHARAVEADGLAVMVEAVLHAVNSGRGARLVEHRSGFLSERHASHPRFRGQKLRAGKWQSDDSHVAEIGGDGESLVAEPVGGHASGQRHYGGDLSIVGVAHGEPLVPFAWMGLGFLEFLEQHASCRNYLVLRRCRHSDSGRQDDCKKRSVHISVGIGFSN